MCGWTRLGCSVGWCLGSRKANGRALRFAAEELKGDGEVVLAAARENGYALQYDTEALRGEGGGGCPYVDLPLPSYWLPQAAGASGWS
eukprot:4597779-Amphidinium_carterae.1